FKLLAQAGGIPERDMFNTFNMGVGMCVVVARDEAQTALDTLAKCGETAYYLGEVKNGEKAVRIC
ncbi:MAG: AIR synthase-related protein, partial [Hydrogenoanaerobacterium sp.]